MEEEVASKRLGLGIRLLPASSEDSASASKVKFSSKFERNRKDKRAAINAASIFPESSLGSAKKRLELESKRRKIEATAASTLLTGKFKPSSFSRSSVSATGLKRVGVVSRR